jgi:hypothetical protein
METIDKGSRRKFDDVHDRRQANTRVWVLDPIDGTKGFLRWEHFCFAVCLMFVGVPGLSVLGCQIVRTVAVISKQLSRSQGDPNSPDIQTVDCTIDDPLALDQTKLKPLPAVIHQWPFGCRNGRDGGNENIIFVYPPKAGSIFYAVSDLGAYVMPLGDTGGKYGDSVRVSARPELEPANSVASHLNDEHACVTLCESAEATHGNRKLSATIHRNLRQLLKDEIGTTPTVNFLRMDGQGKHALVGSGVAAATLRLPPAGRSPTDSDVLE